VVHSVPTGTGLHLMASDDNEIHDNDVKDNGSVGVAVISFYLSMRAPNDPKYDAFPEGNWVHDNRLTNNGTDLDGLAFTLAAGFGLKTLEDLLWDGVVDTKKTNTNMALTNCFKDN